MELTLRRPFDAHVHLRDGVFLDTVVPQVAAHFGRALVMPNLQPPVTTVAEAEGYRQRILARVPAGRDFDPLMSLYLTPTTTPAEIERAAASPVVVAVKLYPAGATTHSAAGVRDFERLDPVLDAMAEHGLLLLVHGEVTDDEIDIFDREARFVDRVLGPLVERHRRLRVVLEHVSTRAGVDFVMGAHEGVAATLTAHHLLHNRNDLLAGGVRPHYYCLPVLKREEDRRALVEAAVTGDRFFLGTDSAPHPRAAKESACGCAGAYTTPVALALYAACFAGAGALDRLEDFAVGRGERFYGLEPTPGRLRLRRVRQVVPDSYAVGEDCLVPLHAGEALEWSVEDVPTAGA